jgi:hypothetical protein
MKNGIDVLAGPATEGEITKAIEDVTAKLPSTTYLALALGAMGVSAILKCF